MAQYMLPGEDILQAMGLEHASAKEFHGVMVYRLWGTQAEIRTATDVLQSVYSTSEFSTLGDAKWIGTTEGSVEGMKVHVDLYELIVMRTVKKE